MQSGILLADEQPAFGGRRCSIGQSQSRAQRHRDPRNSAASYTITENAPPIRDQTHPISRLPYHLAALL